MNEVVYALDIGPKNVMLRTEEETRTFTGRLLVTMGVPPNPSMHVDAEIELISRPPLGTTEVRYYGERLFSIPLPDKEEDRLPSVRLIRTVMLLLAGNDLGANWCFQAIQDVLLWHLQRHEDDRQELATYAPDCAKRSEPELTD